MKSLVVWLMELEDKMAENPDTLTESHYRLYNQIQLVRQDAHSTIASLVHQLDNELREVEETPRKTWKLFNS